MEGPGPLCLACAELDHLVFLGRGDAALTRRAKSASRLWAVGIRFSRSRKRYERQGLLVEEHALKKAEAECLADAEVRARRKARGAERRADQDEALARSMADGIRRLFPRCPPEEAEAIARHATLRSSGRVGRTAAAKEMEERPLVLAVVAAVRHQYTRYDELLMSGLERSEARVPRRSEERRVGKECRSRWSPYHEKKKPGISAEGTFRAEEGGGEIFVR